MPSRLTQALYGAVGDRCWTLTIKKPRHGVDLISAKCLKSGGVTPIGGDYAISVEGVQIRFALGVL